MFTRHETQRWRMMVATVLKPKGRLGRALLGLVIVLAAAACSGDSDSRPANDGQPPDGLGIARRSMVEDLPVPETAKVAPGGKFSGGPFDLDAVTYVLPENVTGVEAEAWYVKRDLAGRDWHDWSWCGGEPGQRQAHEAAYVWERPDLDRVLALTPEEDANDFSPTFGRTIITMYSAAAADSPVVAVCRE
jgi:hypothetical protein